MERPHRILITGGRDFIDWSLFRKTLYDICDQRGWYLPVDDYENTLPNVVIIHGMARGADQLADEWAVLNWCEVDSYPAIWNVNRKYIHNAGSIRNQQMLDEGKPDLVVAFPTKNSRGTWDMVRRAKKAGVETIIVQ